MAVENQQVNLTFKAGEDLNTDGHQYKAIALNDGKLANDGQEASGILKNKPATGEAGNYALSGNIKYVAGGAVAAGVQMTVTTSGFITTAASGDWKVGLNGINAVTSGSVGNGNFDFTTPVYLTSSFE